MGTKCSKTPESRGHDQKYTTPSRLHKTSNGPSPGGHRKGVGFAEVGNLGTKRDQAGWGMNFADARSHDGKATHSVERRKEDKPKLARGMSTTMRSKTSTVAKKGALKVSEVLRGAGTVGLGALDTFSSSVANLNSRGFAGGALSKGNKIGILAFEVANTIVKGCTLKMSLGEEDIRTLKEEILVSEGVHRLVSTDHDELLLIAAADKRKELKVYADEVVRFGNHCRDPQWHGYDRVFQRLVKETEITRLSSEEADKIMDELMNLAQNTADLYHELHALDRFRIDLKRKQQEEDQLASVGGRGGESVTLLKSEVKSQEKHVEALKKRSLWSRTLEEVMEHLVDIANYLYQEIHDNFGPGVFLEAPEEETKRNAGKLGTSGLALHYANIINQIDSLMLRPGPVPPSTRDNLYQGLPPSVKAALRSRLQYSPHGDELGYELSADEIKEDVYKILKWLVPIANNTTKAHHGFGWVGEWANTGSPADRKAMGYVEITLIQTLHHANQQRVEKYILELIVGLHRLVSLAINNSSSHFNSGDLTPPKSPVRVRVKPTMPLFLLSDRSVSPPPFGMFSSAEYTERLAQQLAGYSLPELSQEDKDMLCNIGSDYTEQRIIPGLSRSQEFDNRKAAANREYLKLSKSSSHSQTSTNQFEAPLYRLRNRVKPLGLNMRRLDERESDGFEPLQSENQSES